MNRTVGSVSELLDHFPATHKIPS